LQRYLFGAPFAGAAPGAAVPGVALGAMAPGGVPLLAGAALAGAVSLGVTVKPPLGGVAGVTCDDWFSCESCSRMLLEGALLRVPT